MKAIIYTTNSGSSELYAKLLSRETGLPAYSLKQAKKSVPAKAEVIYLGWIMANVVKGYANAQKRYKICAVCGVGMAQTGTQKELVREKTKVPESIPLFTLQGNFDVKKLHGVYRVMMNFALKGLKDKKNRTKDEEEMLDMMLHGGDRVSLENLNAVLFWYREQK